MSTDDVISLGDICQALSVSSREARYILERGFVPKGVDENPCTGNHRRFNAEQSLWMALVLKLKANRISTGTAATLADYALRAVRTYTQNLGWDPAFLPMAGRFDTEHMYFIEVGDLSCMRFATDSCPSQVGLHFSDWHRLNRPNTPIKEFTPCVLVRVDISAICRLLGATFKSRADE